MILPERKKKRLGKFEKKMALETLKHYRNAYSCRACKVIYGSDVDKDDGLCPKCSHRLLKGGKKKHGKSTSTYSKAL